MQDGFKEDGNNESEKYDESTGSMENHPKLLPFIRAVEQDGITADTIIEVTVKTPQGKERTANIRVKQSDVDLIRALKQDR